MATERTAGDVEGAELLEALIAASRALTALAARSLVAVEEEVTLPQYRVLLLLASRGSLRVAELGAHLGVRPSTATRMADRLERKGLLRRQAADLDRREVLLALTARGKALVEEVTARRRRELAQVIARLSLAEQREMVALFRRFARAAGEPLDREWPDPLAV